jgi:hypothetical protein
VAAGGAVVLKTNGMLWTSTMHLILFSLAFVLQSLRFRH